MIDPGQLAWRLLGVLLHKRRRAIALVLFITVVFGAGVHAQTGAAPSTVLGMIDGRFQPLQAQWAASIKITAARLFVSLMGIDFLVARILKLLEGGDTIEALVGGLGKQILRYGFFFALLKFSDTWLPAIIDSFRKIGSNAAGGTNATPDGIIDAGGTTALAIMQSLHSLGLGEAAMMAVPLMFWALLVYLCFVYVAIQVLVTNIEIYLMCGAGVILLGMGGSLWTKDMAVNVYKYAVQVGVKLMMLMLIVAAGQTIFQGQLIDQDNFLKSTLSVGAVALGYAYLSFKAPALAGGMLSGTSSLSAGDGLGAALGLAAGGAALGAGAVAGVGLAAQGAGAAAQGASSAIAGAQGLGQALGAGFESAADHGKSGFGAAAHAAGEVAGHGLGLARMTAGNAAKRASAAHDQKVASSIGARIAQRIEGTRGGGLIPGGASGAQAPNAPETSTQGGGDVGTSGDAPQASSSIDAQVTEAEAPSVMQSLGAGVAPGGKSSGAADASGEVRPPNVERPSAAEAPGNATGATLEGGAPEDSAAGDSSPVRRPAPSSGDRYRRPLHEQLSGLKSHIPDDSAGAAHVAIDTNAHGR